MIFQLVLASALSGQGPHWDAMTRANEAASLCAIGHGVRLDDRRTSPEIIARAAMTACFDELNRLDSSVKNNAAVEIANVPFAQSDPLVQTMIQRTRRRIEDLTIQAILEQRAKNAPNP